MTEQQEAAKPYHYAFFSQKLADAYRPQGIPVHSFLTIDGKWVKMTHKKTSSELLHEPTYWPDGVRDYTNPADLKFMGIVKFPLVMWQQS